MTRHAMLKSGRYTGLRDREFSVDWLQPPAAPTIIVACGPRRISEEMSTTYDTDMFEPLAIGTCTLNAEGGGAGPAARRLKYTGSRLEVSAPPDDATT